MKHILFPTVDAADAFIADLQGQGAIQPQLGSTTLNRRTPGSLSTADMDSTAPLVTGPATDEDIGISSGGTAEDAGAGAIKGTVAGAVTGAAVGLIGTAATVATGGLALPVILGMAALGSGVGAAVGGIGGASGVDETGTGTGYAATSDVDDEYYDRINSGVTAGGRAVAVDDSVPQDVLQSAMQAHGGHFV